MATIKTTLHYYRLDMRHLGQNAQYEALRKTLEMRGIRCQNSFASEVHFDSYRAKVKALDEKEIHLETDFLFSDQWNTEEGLHVHNWFEYVWPSPSIKEGYYLDQTDEMKAVLGNTAKCGYCGHQEAVVAGHKFCPSCIDSEYLQFDELHLTRMLPVSSMTPRLPLTEEEKAERLPVYKNAQIHGASERGKARVATARLTLQKNYERDVQIATTERDGFLWLLDHGIKRDNVIYYCHTDTFCFGWKTPIDQTVKESLIKELEGFPFKYEFK